MSETIKLKGNTWYYFYADDNGGVSISSEPPIRDEELKRTPDEFMRNPLADGWHHPENKMKCTGAFHTGN